MSDRVTREQLANVLDAVRSAATAAGVREADGWRLDVGSKTYGRAYRLWLTKPDGTGAHYSPCVGDFLGMTAPEALHSLQVLRSAFAAVTWSRRVD